MKKILPSPIAVISNPKEFYKFIELLEKEYKKPPV